MIELTPEERYSVVMQMAEALLAKGSWCGETHLQKALYIFNEVSDRPLGYQFILYKHGPFSFDLRSELGEMKAARLIELASRNERYGPSILPTEFGKRIRQRSMGRATRYLDRLNAVADWIGPRNVIELERISTAVLVNDELRNETVAARAARLHEYKPHIPLQDAEAAIREAETKVDDAKKIGLVKRSSSKS